MADDLLEKDIPADLLREMVELEQIGTQAAREAQAENRRLGIPNAYARNGTLYFELPDGTITQDDPFVEDDASTQT